MPSFQALMGVGWGYPLSDFGSRTLRDPLPRLFYFVRYGWYYAGMNSVFNIRWPDTDLVSRLKVLAVANRRSLQAEVLVALERHVALVLPAVAPDVVREVESFARAEVSAEVVRQPESVLSESSRVQIELLKENDRRRALERPADLPSASQVAKRSFTPDFK